MLLCLYAEELCLKEENKDTDCTLNFGKLSTVHHKSKFFNIHISKIDIYTLRKEKKLQFYLRNMYIEIFFFLPVKRHHNCYPYEVGEFEAKNLL